ncbi:hypothetical protein DDE82_008551 [Stemphylium lycopersici]|uniref:Uncharacterized protein n=1 Tax=Stemphylium lycopersici TaxID=183478 RepID=A0A364MSA8_STELY|nr:hypothetical protein TW65_06329 [Stemphylium lycopersici]RAQ99161.1 hypothetical protein DDE82_008551 [Stemphylium lycopersici]RAR01248.1 hypothetical protein DDE83_008950 [Stemphylium lycopersici]
MAEPERIASDVWHATIIRETLGGQTPNQSTPCFDSQRNPTSTIPGSPKLKVFKIGNLSSHGETACGYTFSDAIKTFSDPRVPANPKLNLCISADDPSRNTHLLYPTAQLWKETFAPKVHSLNLVTHEGGDNTDEAVFLYSLSDLQYFTVEGKLPCWTWEILSWPMLNTMELRALTVPNKGFVTFIVRHSKTLSCITLEDVTVREDTWEEPLEKITGIKELSYVRLVDLYQHRLSAETSYSLKRDYLKMDSMVVFNNRDEIGMAAGVIRHSLSTTPSTSEEFDLVDFSRLKATVEVKIAHK